MRFKKPLFLKGFFNNSWRSDMCQKTDIYLCLRHFIIQPQFPQTVLKNALFIFTIYKVYIAKIMVKYLYKVGIFLLRKDENKLDLMDLSEKINAQIENFEKVNDIFNDDEEDFYEGAEDININIMKTIITAKKLIITNPILSEDFIKHVNKFKESVSTKEIERIKKIPEKIFKYIKTSLKDNEIYDENWIITPSMTKFYDVNAINVYIYDEENSKKNNDDFDEEQLNYMYTDVPMLYLYSSLNIIYDTGDKPAIIGHSINGFYEENFSNDLLKIINPPENLSFYLINFLIQKNLELDNIFMYLFFASAMWEVLLYMNDYLDNHINEMFSKKISKTQKITPRKYTIKIQENRDKVLSIYLNSQQIKMSDDWINLIYSVSKNKYSLQEEYNKFFGNTQNDSEANLKKFRIDISNKINKINKRIKENLQIVDKSLKKEDIDKMTLLSLPRGSENLFIDYEIFDIIY